MFKNFNFKKIKQFWKRLTTDKDTLTLIILTIVSVVVATIYFFMSQAQQGTPEDDYYEIPESLNNAQNQQNDLDWDQVSITPEEIDGEDLELSAYQAEVFSIEQINTILIRFGFAGSSAEILANGDLYSWTKDNIATASYTPDRGSLVIASNNGIRLEGIERGYITSETAEEYFNEFMSYYFEKENEYEIEVTENGNMFKVRGSWILDGYNLVDATQTENMIAVVFDDGGDLMELSITLLELSKKDSQVDMLSTQELKQYVQSDAYPKQAFMDVIAAPENQCNDYDCYYNYNFDEVKALTIDDVEVVYYFDPLTPQSVLPIFKLKGEGTVYDRIDETSRRVLITIYANSVNPEKLLTGGDE
jgi:hypothetical protein